MPLTPPLNQAALLLSGRFSGSRFSASQEAQDDDESLASDSIVDSRLQFTLSPALRPSPERPCDGSPTPEEQEASLFAPLVPGVDDAPVRLSSPERAIAAMNLSRVSDWSEVTGVYKNNFVDANAKDQVPTKCARYLGSNKNPQYLMAHCIGLKAESATQSYGAMNEPIPCSFRISLLFKRRLKE